VRKPPNSCYVHSPGIDNPIVWYEGSGASDRRFLMADERGSIVSISDSAGAIININAYDEYGVTVTVYLTPKLSVSRLARGHVMPCPRCTPPALRPLRTSAELQ
jgi:hypothetical protein